MNNPEERNMSQEEGKDNVVELRDELEAKFKSGAGVKELQPIVEAIATQCADHTVWKDVDRKAWEKEYDQEYDRLEETYLLNNNN
ncbi:MAG: hypothetical protein WCT08_00275 [Patescibacteria group bacterium]|jgi:hypothetical protein